ncbi:uncharacterized protein EAF01_005024 [Botrytis porri]|uniref:uncharacterized protein n=1 Tax=Botrytis porri TaxID=87229 RepID=UPI0018FFB646|nr:uncharacterized protein EAF01_005024 [Botrytis porri]KAF7907438.1 hypothetical protein EAF01_005024 [Botrytis porri]
MPNLEYPALSISARSSLASVEKEIKEVCKSANIPVPSVLALKLDVLDCASVADAAKSIETTFGRLDILINNAAYLSGTANVANGDHDEWWMNWEVNVRGVYWATKCLLPLLLKTDGGDKTIVNLASVAALLMSPGMSGCQMSKFALVKFTERLCIEYADQGWELQFSLSFIGMTESYDGILMLNLVVLAYSVHPGSVMADLSKGLPEKSHEILIAWMICSFSFPRNVTDLHAIVLTDTPELAGNTIPCLTSQKREWLAGRYLSSN